MRITVRHVIVQEFAPPARSLIQKMRLRPRACESQHVTSWSIESDVDCQMRERQDAFGNFVSSVPQKPKMGAAISCRRWTPRGRCRS